MAQEKKDTVNIHGKAYETVASRVHRFRQEHGSDYGIITEIIDRDSDTVVIKAMIVLFNDPDNRVIATGFAEESRTASTINKTSALENCETSAIGRALAAFGMAGTEYASADEVAQAISKQPYAGGGAPIAPLQGMATDKQRQIIQKHLNSIGIVEDDHKEFLISEWGVKLPLSKEDASSIISDIFAEKPEGDHDNS